MTLLLILAACPGGGDDTAVEAWAPDTHCPGGPDCADADGPLSAGAAAIAITPTCFESWIDPVGEAEWESDHGWLDCGCDRLCPDDEGYPGPDEGEGDGEFQAVWLAGFHNGRPATGVHDDLWARALVFDQGSTRVAVVALDVVGWFYDEVVRTRAMLADTDLGIDLLVVHATHNHEGPDTLGIWGRTETRPGRDDAWQASVREATVESVRLAVADLREVGSFRLGSTDISTYHDSGVLNVLNDYRDPFIVDQVLDALHLADTDGQTIATVAHFSNHPESMADENALITSDYPHALREVLEDGVQMGDTTLEGYGGTAIFWNGAVGGMMTPLGTTTTDLDGTEYRAYTFDHTEAIGRNKALIASDTIEAATPATELDLAFATSVFKLPVDNYGFQAMFLSGIFDREILDWDSSEVISEDNLPWIRTELVHLEVGPLELLTIPGELLPELALGGYDGSATGSDQATLIDPGNENPPDLSQAPDGPYLEDHLASADPWLLGLGNDEIGYIIPPYDFQLDEVNPYFDEPPGDHYEETNSLGARTAPMLEERILELLGWVYSD